jgi:hypothetical protein
LVWVLRALAVLAGIWGLIGIAQSLEASRAVREFPQEFRGFPGDPEQRTKAVQSATTAAVFTALITTVAMVAVPLALAEGLRLCILIEANTRIGRQLPLREKGKRRDT